MQSYVNICLQELWEEYGDKCATMVECFDKPIGVKAKVDIQRGGITLCPHTERVKTSETKGGINLGTFTLYGHSIALSLAPHLVYDETKDTSVAPFWCVGPTQNAGSANMETKYKECKFKEYKFRIPILVNKKKINKGGVSLEMK